MTGKIEKGAWVKVWGQVAKTGDEQGVHPEDTLVEFFSHNEQYQGHVRTDRIETAKGLPKWAARCTALAELSFESIKRCMGHDRHGGDHWHGDDKWTDGECYGHVEEA